VAEEDSPVADLAAEAEARFEMLLSSGLTSLLFIPSRKLSTVVRRLAPPAAPPDHWF
jgi:hypothetical protein